MLCRCQSGCRFVPVQVYYFPDYFIPAISYFFLNFLLFISTYVGRTDRINGRVLVNYEFVKGGDVIRNRVEDSIVYGFILFRRALPFFLAWGWRVYEYFRAGFPVIQLIMTVRDRFRYVGNIVTWFFVGLVSQRYDLYRSANQELRVDAIYLFDSFI